MALAHGGLCYVPWLENLRKEDKRALTEGMFLPD